jgi:hypothetical protein
MTDSNSRKKIFAIMWDCYGLESVIQLPDPADATFALLKNQEPPKMPNLSHWKLRARYNPQRNYEIYIITAESEIEKNDIVEMFNAAPQDAADTIRRIGEKFYSDRDTSERLIR